MKIFRSVMKILAALAAVAGVVYVVATYGDKIVAFAKKLMGKCPCCEGEEAPVEEPVEEEAAEEPITEEVAEEPAVEEVVVEEAAPVAEENDFEAE